MSHTSHGISFYQQEVDTTGDLTSLSAAESLFNDLEVPPDGWVKWADLEQTSSITQQTLIFSTIQSPVPETVSFPSTSSSSSSTSPSTFSSSSSSSSPSSTSSLTSSPSSSLSSPPPSSSSSSSSVSTSSTPLSSLEPPLEYSPSPYVNFLVNPQRRLRNPAPPEMLEIELKGYEQQEPTGELTYVWFYNWARKRKRKQPSVSTPVLPVILILNHSCQQDSTVQLRSRDTLPGKHADYDVEGTRITLHPTHLPQAVYLKFEGLENTTSAGRQAPTFYFDAYVHCEQCLVEKTVQAPPLHLRSVRTEPTNKDGAAQQQLRDGYEDFKEKVLLWHQQLQQQNVRLEPVIVVTRVYSSAKEPLDVIFRRLHEQYPQKVDKLLRDLSLQLFGKGEEDEEEEFPCSISLQRLLVIKFTGTSCRISNNYTQAVQISIERFTGGQHETDSREVQSVVRNGHCRIGLSSDPADACLVSCVAKDKEKRRSFVEQHIIFYDEEGELVSKSNHDELPAGTDDDEEPGDDDAPENHDEDVNVKGD